MPAEEHIRYAPEPAAVELRVVVWSAIAALILLVGAIVGLRAVYQDAVPLKAVQAPTPFPQPRVDTHAADIAKLHRLAAEQSERLKKWGWANDQHTLVQIPIERAMQLLAQEGPDAYAPLLPPSAMSSPTAAAERATTPNPPAAATQNPVPEPKP